MFYFCSASVFRNLGAARRGSVGPKAASFDAAQSRLVILKRAMVRSLDLLHELEGAAGFDLLIALRVDLR
jgi:hypothetical protein